MTNATTTTAPRIYVACLAAYNNGILHGAWIDADQSADELHEDVKKMLAASPEPGAEEWAIHDFEGFGELRLSEWDSFERVSVIATGIAEHGPAFSAWLSYDPEREPIDASAFEDAYRGEWDSLRKYAEDFADEIGPSDSPLRMRTMILSRIGRLSLLPETSSSGGFGVIACPWMPA